jgi:beta-phosphoglucomutase family hydrolase
MMLGFIFDLDGTLADTMPAHYRAWQVTAKHYGLSFPEDTFYALGGMPTRKIAAMLVEQAKVDADPLEVATHKEQVFVASLSTPGIIKPIAPVVEIARAHRADGPLAIASGGQRHLVERTLDMIGITDWFAVVLTSEDTTRHKPEPDVFLEAARRLGAEPTACTVYEDTDIGLEAARRANMRGVDVRPLYERRVITTLLR